MRAIVIALACVTGACVDEPELHGDPLAMTGQFELHVVRQIGAERAVAGIDTDRAGGLWIAYSIPTGGYYANDDVRVVHLDANGTKTKEHRFMDELADVDGIAFSGDAVWINHSGGNDYMRAIDPETGAVTRTFATETGIVDLDARGDELLLSRPYNVVGLDARTGGEKWRSYRPFETDSLQRGIASMADGRIWLGNLTDRFYVLDPKVGIVGGATHELLGYDDWTVDAGMHLAWDGELLIVALDGQIYWLEAR